MLENRKRVFQNRKRCSKKVNGIKWGMLVTETLWFKIFEFMNSNMSFFTQRFIYILGWFGPWCGGEARRLYRVHDLARLQLIISQLRHQLAVRGAARFSNRGFDIKNCAPNSNAHMTKKNTTSKNLYWYHDFIGRKFAAGDGESLDFKSKFDVL